MLNSLSPFYFSVQDSRPGLDVVHIRDGIPLQVIFLKTPSQEHPEMTFPSDFRFNQADSDD